MMRRTRFALIASLPCVLLLFALACGGGSSSKNNNGGGGGGGGGGSTASNQVPLSVNAGPGTLANFNAAYVSVTVCKPGTSTCVTVPNVELDTGATGLRLLSSTVSGLGLTNVTSGGQTLTNCVQYLDNSYQWGPVATVDVSLAGEVAHSVPIQIVAEPDYAFPAAPASCGGTPVNTVDALLANGFLGLSFYQQDCGPACASTTPPTGFYYACGSSSCSPTSVSLAQQLPNVGGLFDSDNNGIVVTLESVPASGLPSATGTLTFGIGTQSDNALGGAVVLTPDDLGNFTTRLGNGTPTQVGFIDSGSNGLYFLNSAETGLPECTTYTGFYCPTNPVSLTATNTGSNGKTSTVSFSVANGEALLNSTNNAFSNVAGTGDDTADPAYGLYFDWGLPFFYGKSVFVALEGTSAAGTEGPYWAY